MTFFLRWKSKEFVHFLRRLYQQKHALIFRSFASMEIHRILCALSFYHREGLGMRRMLHAPIDGPHPFLGIILSTGFVQQNPAYKFVHRAIRRAGEARLTDGIRKKTNMFPTVVRMLVPKKDWPSLKICYSKLGDLSVSHLFVPNITSMRFLFTMTITLLLVALAHLLLEQYTCKSALVVQTVNLLGIPLSCFKERSKSKHRLRKTRVHPLQQQQLLQ